MSPGKRGARVGVPCGFPGGRRLWAGSGQYGGSRRRAARIEVVTGGGANRENLP